jgi:hypothetical protein
MTIRTNEPNHGRDAREQVDVAPGVPVDRIRWGPILIGLFAALTVLAVLSILGTAVGLSAYDAGDDARRFAVGAGLWGIISMLLAFGFGGWMAARSAAVHGGNAGLFNGFMVAAVGIPVLLGVFGGAGALMSHAEVSNDRDDRNVSRAGQTGQFDAAQGAQTAAAVIPGDSVAPPSDSARSNQARPDGARVEEARRAARTTAWTTLIALVLTLTAASIGGQMGGREDHHGGDRGDHSGRSRGLLAGANSGT